jgi:hypothetical protein
MTSSKAGSSVMYRSAKRRAIIAWWFRPTRGVDGDILDVREHLQDVAGHLSLRMARARLDPQRAGDPLRIGRDRALEIGLGRDAGSLLRGRGLIVWIRTENATGNGFEVVIGWIRRREETSCRA